MPDNIRKGIAFACAILFVISALMSGTYAWDSEQKVLNDLFGNKTKMMTVELLKLEKHTDGTVSNKPISGTVFYLFKENGTQIGGRYVTDENGKINVTLSMGSYYFEEAAPSVGYTYDTDKDGKPITKYYFTVVEQYEKVIVKAYNIKLTGDLLIRKVLENSDGSPLTDWQKETAFSFTVTFSDGGTYRYRIDGGEEKTLASGGVIKLKHNQTAVFEGLPVDVIYNVTEDVPAGYTSTSTGHRGNITEKQSVAEFINRADAESFGSLTVTKAVVGKNADLTKEFSFIATVGNVTEEFTLRHGESKTFSGVPVGTEYTVREADSGLNGYTPSIKEYNGQIVNSEAVELPFVNVYDMDPDEKFGSLTVNKKVIGENSDPNKEFTFTVVFEGNGAPKSETFTLRAGDTKIFENIPYGVTYAVTETDAKGYVPVLDTASGIIAGGHNVNVTFTNMSPEPPAPQKTIKLTVKKLLAGELVESDKLREFSFILTVDGTDTEFVLRADETKEFEIPVGSVYSLWEADYFADGFSQFIVNGSGTATEALTEVIVTNTYVGEPRVEINGEKTWDMNGYDDVVLPESITVQLKNGDTLVEEKVVTPDENGLWQYSFIAPKYNPDGSEAQYTLVEKTIPSYRATYEGYNIKNTYVKPIEVDPPIITKFVTGEKVPTTVFEFVFSGQHGTPMPEGSEGYRKTMTLIGAGELEIGTITYDKAGTYVYTVHEKNSGANGWTYDTALYTVTVVVTETDYVLSAETSIKKNGSDTDMLVFTNTFEAIKDETVIVSGIKTWDHGNNPDKDRPTSIIVEVYGDGELVVQRQVTAEDNWQYSFELPRFAEDGHEIVYTIDEADVENYEKRIDGYDIINTYVGTPDVPPDTPAPPTGDNFNLNLWLTLMILSLIGLIVTIRKGRRLRL